MEIIQGKQITKPIKKATINQASWLSQIKQNIEISTPLNDIVRIHICKANNDLWENDLKLIKDNVPNNIIFFRSSEIISFYALQGWLNIEY